MDLRAYYQKVRDTEAGISTPYVVLVSLATPDGGKPGVVTEVPTLIGARMIVEGSARQATSQETQTFRESRSTAKQAAEDAMAASKVHVVVVPASSTLKPAIRGGKEQ